jgi:hypothetical protein
MGDGGAKEILRRTLAGLQTLPVAQLARTEKVNGPERDFGLDFGGRIGRGRVVEALRSASAVSVWAERRSTAAFRPGLDLPAWESTGA